MIILVKKITAKEMWQRLLSKEFGSHPDHDPTLHNTTD
jgi:hypothetical protein